MSEFAEVIERWKTLCADNMRTHGGCIMCPVKKATLDRGFVQCRKLMRYFPKEFEENVMKER